MAAKLHRPVSVCECASHAFVSTNKWGVVLVSPEDAYLLHDHTWTIMRGKRHPYAQNHSLYAKIGQGLIHKHILKDVPMIDHINGNGLDNRRENLRAASQSQNNMNARKRRGKSSSQHKGVRWRPDKGKWHAYIVFDGKQRNLGLYNDEIEAAEAYNAAASVYFGAFARLNDLPRAVAA